MSPIILYENLLENGTLTASSTASGYDIDNLIDRRSYTKWKAANTATQTISLTLSSADRVDTIGIYNHNLGTIGATVTLEIYVATVWVEMLTFSPTDDKAILKLVETIGTETQWRITIAGATSPPEIGVIMIGDKLVFPFPPQTPIIPSEESVVVSALKNKAGHTLGNDVNYFPSKTNASFTNILRSWIESNFEPFYHNYGKKLFPFFYAWDLTGSPNEIIFATLSPEMVYATPLKISNYAENLNLMMNSLNEDY